MAIKESIHHLFIVKAYYFLTTKNSLIFLYRMNINTNRWKPVQLHNFIIFSVSEWKIPTLLRTCVVGNGILGIMITHWWCVQTVTGICRVILPDVFEKLSLHPNSKSCYTKSHHHMTLCCMVIYVYMRMALACYLQMWIWTPCHNSIS